MLRLGTFLKRFYFRPRDLPIYKHDMMVSMVPNFINCQQSLEFLQVNEGQIPPKVIGDVLLTICSLQLPLDEHWPEICKHVKTIIAEYNRHVITDLFRVTRYMAEIGETNQEFWDLIEKKLMGEGLVRYLSEKEAAQLLWGLCRVNQGSEQLWKRLENEVARHHFSLDYDDVREAIYGLEVSGKGSKEVIATLKGHLKEHELSLLV
jgi:hypothetical protein